MSESLQNNVEAGWAHRDGLIHLASPSGVGDRALGTEDRLAIHELFARYAIAYDERRLDVLRDCFTEDGVYEVRMGSRQMARFAGSDNVIAGMDAVMQQQGPAQRRHVMANIVLQPVESGAVSAIAYAVVIVTASAPSLGAAAVYGATVVRVAGAWKFRTVLLGMDGYAGTAPTS